MNREVCIPMEDHGDEEQVICTYATIVVDFQSLGKGLKRFPTPNPPL